MSLDSIPQLPTTVVSPAQDFPRRSQCACVSTAVRNRNNRSIAYRRARVGDRTLRAGDGQKGQHQGEDAAGRPKRVAFHSEKRSRARPRYRALRPAYCCGLRGDHTMPIVPSPDVGAICGYLPKKCAWSCALAGRSMSPHHESKVVQRAYEPVGHPTDSTLESNAPPPYRSTRVRFWNQPALVVSSR